MRPKADRLKQRRIQAATQYFTSRGKKRDDSQSDDRDVHTQGESAVKARSDSVGRGADRGAHTSRTEEEERTQHIRDVEKGKVASREGEVDTESTGSHTQDRPGKRARQREEFSGKTPRVVIGLVTVKRNSSESLGYALQSAAALDSLLHRHRHNDLFSHSLLYICNVDYNPDLHEDAVFLKDYVTTVERYGVSSSPLASEVSSLTIPWLDPPVTYRELRHPLVLEKERFDYMFCLHAGLLFHPRYVLLVEDDALALPDMPGVVEHALNRVRHALDTRPHHPTFHVRWNASEAPCPSNYSEPLEELVDSAREAFPAGPVSVPRFAYLKLYFPPLWQGFALEVPQLLDLFSVTVVLAALLTGVMTLVLRRSPSPRTVRQVVVVSLVLVLLTGRQNANELRRVSRHLYRLQTSPDCCTPAVLYPADVIPPLVTWLVHSGPRAHVDLCIAEFVRRFALPAFIVEPNLFSHIGQVTSLNLTRNRSDSDEVLFHDSLTYF